MNKCSPVDMRISLEMVDLMKKCGIRFVPMPVLGDEDFKIKMEEMQFILSIIEGECEEE